MKIEELLKEFGNAAGMRDLALNENNVCRIVFDEKLTVDIEALPDGDTFFFHAVVCAVPQENKQEFFAGLLAANLFGHETGDASFGLDANLDEIVLFQKLSEEKTDYQAFVSALEVFVDRVDHWTDRAASLGAAEDGARAGDPAETMLSTGGEGIIKA